MSLRTTVRRHGLLGLLLAPVWRRVLLGAWCLAWGHNKPFWSGPTYEGHWACGRCGANLGNTP